MSEGFCNKTMMLKMEKCAADNKLELLSSLSIASNDVGAQYCDPKSIANCISNLTREQLADYAFDRQSPIWWFYAPIAYALLGPQALQEQVEVAETTIAVISPPFLAHARVVCNEFEVLGCGVALRWISYSRRMCALLYGGYPWFPAFHRAIHDLELVDKPAVALDLALPPDLTPNVLNEHKLRIRALLPPPIRVEYPDLPFPGLVRSLHMPEPIEIERHIRATRL